MTDYFSFGTLLLDFDRQSSLLSLFYSPVMVLTSSVLTCSDARADVSLAGSVASGSVLAGSFCSSSSISRSVVAAALC